MGSCTILKLYHNPNFHISLCMYSRLHPLPIFSLYWAKICAEHLRILKNATCGHLKKAFQNGYWNHIT